METTTKHTPTILEVTETGIDSQDVELMEPDGASFLSVIDSPDGLDEVDFARIVAHRYNSHDALVELVRQYTAHHVTPNGTIVLGSPIQTVTDSLNLLSQVEAGK